MTGAELHFFEDDGLVPNNEDVALRLYRGVLDVTGRAADSDVIAHFARHGWGGAWVNGIYDFQHYHATAHEVLGIVGGWADVQFGGASGITVRVNAGDAVMIPAGVGHCLIASGAGLSVVGAYPEGQELYDLKRARAADRAVALDEICNVALPRLDPITGALFSVTPTLGRLLA